MWFKVLNSVNSVMMIWLLKLPMFCVLLLLIALKKKKLDIEIK